MANTLISITTKSYIVTMDWPDRKVGDVVSTEYAMISVDGQAPREYAVTLHEGCEGEGYKFYTMDAYSDTGHCTGCNFREYNGIGD